MGIWGNGTQSTTSPPSALSPRLQRRTRRPERLGEPLAVPAVPRAPSRVGPAVPFHPDKTGTFALVWFVVLSRIFPPGLFPLPVVGSCQAVAVFVRGQKQRIWTSSTGPRGGGGGGGWGWEAGAGQECHPQEEMSLVNKPGNGSSPLVVKQRQTDTGYHLLSLTLGTVSWVCFSVIIANAGNDAFETVTFKQGL